MYYLWLAPSMLGQVFLRMYLIAEHCECHSHKTRTGGSRHGTNKSSINTNMWNNTRSTKTTWWCRRLAWNMPYHLEHHAFPFVPFHQLPVLHALIVSNLKQQQRRTCSTDQCDDDNGNDNDKVFYAQSGCNPSGKDGYISMHVHFLRKFGLH